MVEVIIDEKKVSVPEGTTIMQAAKEAGVRIPSLCYHPDQSVKGVCRICVVEVQGNTKLQTSCAAKVSEGMVVKTNTPEVIEARKNNLQKIMSTHPIDCHHCVRIGSCESEDLVDEYCKGCTICNCIKDRDCELQNLLVEYEIKELDVEWTEIKCEIDNSSDAIVLDGNKCIACKRCVSACSEFQSVNALEIDSQGAKKIVKAKGGKLSESNCVQCGQCLEACPVGGIYAKKEFNKLMAAIKDSSKTVIAQVDPSIWPEIARLEKVKADETNINLLVSALRRLGVNYVVSNKFTNDMMIQEERKELLNRVNSGNNAPMFSSYCPAWVNYCEKFHSDELSKLSKVKSGHAVFGSIAKGAFAEKINVKSSDIYTVSITDCVSGKSEVQKDNNLDLVLTSREVVEMFDNKCFKFDIIQPSEFDSLQGESVEARLLNVSEIKGIKECEIQLEGKKIKAAVVNSLAAAKEIMEKAKAGQLTYQYVEVMACPKGCKSYEGISGKELL